MDGWIKLHRKSFDNPLYKTNDPHTKREAWEDILIHVNYEDSFFGTLECKRGQSLKSLDSWGKIFNWDKSKVYRFFLYLKKEGMILLETDQKDRTIIETKNERKTIRLTVCKYEDYQGDRNDKKTKNERKTKPIKEVIDKSITKEETIPTWREDFNVYLSECKSAYKSFMENESLMIEQQKLNPGLNLRLTLEKGYINFWGEKYGWENKKSSKSVNIDWKKTITNSIDVKMNRVYLTRQELAL